MKVFKKFNKSFIFILMIQKIYYWHRCIYKILMVTNYVLYWNNQMRMFYNTIDHYYFMFVLNGIAINLNKKMYMRIILVITNIYHKLCA